MKMGRVRPPSRLSSGRAILRLAPVALAACTATPNILPTNDFNRPTDIAFMCFGAFDGSGVPAGPDAGTSGPLRLSGRPMRACHPADALDPGATAGTRTFAFMTDSGSGEISVVDADSWKIVDLNPAVGGYGRAPLGTAAEQISASDDGCRIVSANRGSCDLSVIDPAVLLAPTFDAAYGLDKPLPGPQTYRQVVVPHRPDGSPLGAAPYEVAILPQDTSALSMPATDKLCQSDGAHVPTVGFPATDGAMPWRALVTFPSCDLIALVNLPSGEIVDSWTLIADGSRRPQSFSQGAFPPACPVLDCLGQPSSPASANGGAGSSGTGGAGGGSAAGAGGGGAGGGSGGAAGMGGAAGGTPAGGGSAGTGAGSPGPTGAAPPAGVFRPAGIAIAPPTVPPTGATDAVPVRAYVSLSSADYVLSIDVSSLGLSVPPTATSSDTAPLIAVAGVGGSDRVRLSVNPYKSTTSPGIAGSFIGTKPDRQYLYVVGHDGTVRVVWVLGGQERECETNVDPSKRPANVSEDDWANTACFKVDPTIRRPFVYTPGIQLPSIPIDVAVADVRPTTDTDSEVTVSGAFAYVLTATGTVYLVNIDPTLRKPTIVAKASPDSTGMLVLDPAGTYQSFASPEPTPFASTLRDRNQMSYSASLDPSSGPARVPITPVPSSTQPFLEEFWARGTRNNALATTADPLSTAVYFQDPSAVTGQTWTISWQGPLVAGRYSGKVSGNQLSDGAGFCSSGVLAGDLVTFSGCTDDTQCFPGYKCHRDPTATEASGGLQVTGLCVPPDAEASRAASCPAAFQTLRRYEIQEAHDSSLTLRPHLDELVHSSLTDCLGRNRKNPDGTTGSERDAGSADDGGADGGVPDGAAPDGGDLDGGADGGGAGTDYDCKDVTDPSTAKFRCMRGPAEYDTGKLRCLQTCETSADCRPGRTCWVRGRSCAGQPDKACNSAADCDPKDAQSCRPAGYCADAPPLPQIADCLDQLVPYSVAAGGSYLVSGTATGLLVSGKEGRNGCAPLDPGTDLSDWRYVARIPIADNGLAPPAKQCANVHPVPTDPADAAPLGSPDWHKKFDSRVNPPPDETATPNQPLSWLKTDPVLHETENPCLFTGGPNYSDPDPASRETHTRALFENTQLSFVLTNIDWEPPGFSLRFDVSGGARAQSVLYPPTVEVSEPARIVLGPIDSLPQTTTPAPGFEAPYLFVVDRRRLGRGQGGGPTRGQLLRINPVGFAASTTTPTQTVTGTQPIYEDYTRSGGLFPVQ